MRGCARTLGLGLGLGLALAMTLLGAPARAHGDGHARIGSLNRQLSTDPANVELLLQRADALRAHGHVAEAAADLDRARTLGAAPARWRMARARLWLDQGAPNQALPLLDQQLREAGADTVAMAWRAQALAAVGRHREAAEQWAARLERLSSPEVGDYLALCEAAQHAGQMPVALAALDDGLARLGPLVVLQRRTIELLQGEQQWPQALERLQLLIDSSPRKEALLLWRSRLELADGRFEQAAASRTEALAAWQSLPPAQQATAAMRDLHRQLTGS